jgi:putative resolvase
MNTYRPNEFAKLIAKTTNTLQRWDREGILKANYQIHTFKYVF